MVLVKTSNSIVTIRGRCGGNYFKTDGGSIHLQAMPRHVNYARLGLQGRYRDAYSAAGVFWALALLAFFGALWVAFAIAYQFRKPGHEPKRISGYNWYIHYALTFPERDEFHPFWKPPHAPGELPNYVVTYQGQWTYYHTPADWPADACSGYYFESPIPWNGKTAYRTDDYAWHIWWTGVVWAISPAPGFEPADKTFYSPSPDATDWYRNPVTNKYAHVYNGQRQS